MLLLSLGVVILQTNFISMSESGRNIEQLVANELDKDLQQVGEKIINGQRISFADGVLLFEKGSLPYLGALANWVREQKHGDITYFNRNFHIEPTNVCVFSCAFCAYSKLYAHREEGWELSTEQMMHIIKSYDGKPVTEVHIVGGVHPKLNLAFFTDLMRQIKTHRPELHIKGYTAVELDYMLYGHIEQYHHRIDHMNRLRILQDETGGFNTFIPLKFRNKDNDMSHVHESSVVEDMKLYAVARLYMDNFPHLKAYWPMLGRQNAQLSLSFGVNDLDGTIDDTTKIYSMAGSEEQTPSLSTAQLVSLIKQVRREPVERNTLYNVIKNYKDADISVLEADPLYN